MKTLLAVIMIAFGALGWVGQLISAVRFPLAQRWGLQEGDRETDPLFRRDSLHAARWDAIVLWTLIFAGVLMLVDHPWWPGAALVAGGIYLDGAGRDYLKYSGLRASGVRVGSGNEIRVARFFYGAMFLIAVMVLVYTLTFVLGRSG